MRRERTSETDTFDGIFTALLGVCAAALVLWLARGCASPTSGPVVTTTQLCRVAMVVGFDTPTDMEEQHSALVMGVELAETVEWIDWVFVSKEGPAVETYGRQYVGYPLNSNWGDPLYVHADGVYAPIPPLDSWYWRLTWLEECE